MKHAFCTAACCGLLLSLGAADRLIIEDFSDVGTWRAWSRQNVTPGKWFGADLVLGATPDASRDDGYAGKLRFDFADPAKTGSIEYQRAKASQPEVFADGVEFDADARGIPGKIRFILEDTNGKRFANSPAAAGSVTAPKRAGKPKNSPRPSSSTGSASRLPGFPATITS